MYLLSYTLFGKETGKLWRELDQVLNKTQIYR